MDSITVEPRTVTGKGVKSLRKRGILPAVLYGKGKDTLSISMPQAEFLKLWRSAGESSLVLLKIGQKERNVLIHDVALDPIKNIPIHADFYLVDMTHEVEIDVPITFVGDTEAGKASGGILLKVLHELKIKALPKHLPHTITIDVSALQNPKDSVFIKNIKIPSNITVINNNEELVAIIEEKHASEIEEPVSAETSAAADAIKNIEVVKDKKTTPESSEIEKE